jgi:5-methylcytosine-specific restriction endonuclease McrA
VLIFADNPRFFVGYCTSHATTVDHVVPLSHGGTNDLTNLRPACALHNAS